MRIVLMVVLGALLVATGVSLLLGNTIGLRASSESSITAEDYLLRAGDLERLTVDIETGLRGYVITDRRLFLQPLYSARARVPAAQAALMQSAAADHADQSQSKALAQSIDRYLTGYVEPLLSAAGRDIASARTFAVTLAGKRLVDGIRAQTATLDGAISTRLAARERDAHTSAGHSILEAVVVLVLLTLLTVLLGTVLGRLVVQRDNARRRSEITSRTLQQSILPSSLPEVPGVELAGRFIPATGLVGGDFYDAFAVSARRWAIIIGDVSGKGAPAAALTAMARWTLRSSLESAGSPADALRVLNDTMLRRDMRKQFVTAACMQLELNGAAAHVEIACAGHPPPILVPRDSEPAPVDASGTLLGLVADIDLHSASVELRGGESLVAYTDGVTDQGPKLAPPVELSMRRAAGASAAQLADMLVHAAATLGGPHRDDIAILALRFVGDDRA